MRNYRLVWMWSAFVALLGIVTLAGLEGLSSLVMPDWPARELRPVEATNLASRRGVTGAGALPHYNSWGLNDRERSLRKPAVAGCRAVMVGGSFLEGVCVNKPVCARVGDVWQAEDHRDMEVVSLGISATEPPQCSYRISNVALSLQPHAIVLVFFSGNDFAASFLSSSNLPSPIAVRPLPFWLGPIAPRLTWLAVNRLGLSEFGRSTVSGADVSKIIDLPRADRVDGTWPAPLTGEEVERSVRPEEIAATASWPIGVRDLARAHGVAEPKGVLAIDRQDDPKGVRGSYRVSDGHWTEYGTRIAAKRIAAELLKLR
ncbi:MAG: hypothetical protein KIS73_22130 [Enhydrobacter sp.]|nr:hypothetical protein [Enhydrobacter sp.]